MRECAKCGCYVPEDSNVCPACGTAYRDPGSIVKTVQVESVEVCYRADGTFFVREWEKAKPRAKHKTSPSDRAEA